ncbi:sensor histidine kinase [Fulvivirga lutea]|uniref:histidine kinase n=1 Tax=Fulvivirga lutea TaxID=2810512 RepID=A0A974WE44_9BACT|nr:PAS domain-containing sensor histidine kinase [Fulvivirga lutea]QSE96331.1 PAS domain-containing protein [Fulvivirga lutea]
MASFDNDELLKVFFNESPDALFLINTTDYAIEMCNDAAVQLFEMDSAESFLSKFGHDYHVDEFTPEDIALIQQALDRNQVYRNEYHYKTEKGKYFWAIFETKRVTINNKVFQYVRLIDITEERSKRDSKELELRNLIKEANHRIKNNLSSILSLIHLSIGNSDNENDTRLQELHSRISAVALLHEKLSKTADSNIKIKKYLVEIIEKALMLHPSINILKLNFEIEDLDLANEVALNLGLITSELISNTIKHAYDPENHNFIKLNLQSSQAMRKYTYTDNGLANIKQVNRGLGDEILEVLASQINGEIVSRVPVFKLKF